MKPAIIITDLSKQFNDITAVDHVSLEGDIGEIFGFLGPNGAGKTTTIRIRARVMMISNLVKFPLVFISGVFFRLWDIQEWGRIISLCSPLTYFIDLVEYCIRGESYYTISVDILALVAFSAIFLAIAIKVHEKTMPQRLI